jgi:hypothetical protein
VAEREQHSRVGKLRKLFGKRKEGKKAHGAGLTEQEEREALERDRVWGAAGGDGGGYGMEKEKDDGLIR